MKIHKFTSQKQIKSTTCGLLLEVLNRKDFPFGIVLSKNIKSTNPHYHKKSRKCYWVIEGSVTLIVENIKLEKKEKIILEEGDLITLEPFERHHIINSSKKNKLVTITSPAWHIEDIVG